MHSWIHTIHKHSKYCTSCACSSTAFVSPWNCFCWSIWPTNMPSPPIKPLQSSCYLLSSLQNQNQNQTFKYIPPNINNLSHASIRGCSHPLPGFRLPVPVSDYIFHDAKQQYTIPLKQIPNPVAKHSPWVHSVSKQQFDLRRSRGAATKHHRREEAEEDDIKPGVRS